MGVAATLPELSEWTLTRQRPMNKVHEQIHELANCHAGP